MQCALRSAPALLLLTCLWGCGPGENQTPRTWPGPESVRPDLPRVTVEVQGMS
jgi:hypothetical protein